MEGFEGHFWYVEIPIYRRSWKLKIWLLGETEPRRPRAHKVAHNFSAHFCLVKTPSIATWGPQIHFFMKHSFYRFTNKCLVYSLGRNLQLFSKTHTHMSSKQKLWAWRKLGFPEKVVFLGPILQLRGFWQDRSERKNGAHLYGPRVSYVLSHQIVKALHFHDFR